jgi:hypothetical protein
MPDDFANDKDNELLGTNWIEVTGSCEMPQTADLRGFPFLIAKGQSVPGLQFADRMGALEPLCQHMDDRGIDIVDAISRSRRFEMGSGASTITVSLPCRGGPPEGRRHGPLSVRSATHGGRSPGVASRAQCNARKSLHEKFSPSGADASGDAVRSQI